MSAPEVCCPKCSTRLLLPPGNTATRFRCTKCATVFDLADAAAPAAAVAAPAVAPAPPAPTFTPDPVPTSDFDFPDTQADEPDARPEPRSRTRRAVKDEEPSLSGRRPVRGKSGGKGMKIALLVGAGVLGLTAVAVGGYFAFRTPDPKPSQAKNEPPAPAPKPQKPAPPPLTPEQAIKKVQGSTVYIRNTMREGIASGSGFFAGKPGFIVTNAHVVGYSRDGVTPPTKLEVIIDFGENSERLYPATIYGLDGDQDLALLKVDGPNLPPPLPIGKAEELTPTQPVTAFGYPLGERIGKNMTITSTTISSLKRENGHIVKVQMNGGITHGNSGGPVANAKGEVVGVSVSGIKDNNALVFAIPAETTTRFIEDQFAGPAGKILLGRLAELSPDVLEGQYMIVARESKGKKETESDLKKLSELDRAVVIKGGQFVTFPKGKPTQASIRLDDTESPAHIDLITPKGDETETAYGIYKLKKGVLTICLTKGAETDRPTEFKAEGEATLMTLRKVIPQ